MRGSFSPVHTSVRAPVSPPCEQIVTNYFSPQPASRRCWGWFKEDASGPFWSIPLSTEIRIEKDLRFVALNLVFRACLNVDLPETGAYVSPAFGVALGFAIVRPAWFQGH
jgi:hypothetical protein